ncbi:MAG TPA: hypothetical protein DEB18_16455 [Leeuwenhoekiella sp.]|nr:hypothetical protein [Leeuwenhoekiella sp.]
MRQTQFKIKILENKDAGLTPKTNTKGWSTEKMEKYWIGISAYIGESLQDFFDWLPASIARKHFDGWKETNNDDEWFSKNWQNNIDKTQRITGRVLKGKDESESSSSKVSNWSFVKGAIGSKDPNWGEYFIPTDGDLQHWRSANANTSTKKQAGASGLDPEEMRDLCASNPTEQDLLAMGLPKDLCKNFTSAKPNNKETAKETPKKRIGGQWTDEYGRTVPAVLRGYISQTRDKKTTKEKIKPVISPEKYEEKRKKMLDHIKNKGMFTITVKKPETGELEQQKVGLPGDGWIDLSEMWQKGMKNPNRPKGFSEQTIDVTTKLVYVLAGTGQLGVRFIKGTLTIDQRIEDYTTAYPLERSKIPSQRKLAKWFPVRDWDKSSQLKFLRRFVKDRPESIDLLRKYLVNNGYSNKADLTTRTPGMFGSETLGMDRTRTMNIGKVFKNSESREHFFTGLQPDGKKPAAFKDRAPNLKPSYKFRKIVELQKGRFEKDLNSKDKEQVENAKNNYSDYFEELSLNYNNNYVAKYAGRSEGFTIAQRIPKNIEKAKEKFGEEFKHPEGGKNTRYFMLGHFMVIEKVFFAKIDSDGEITEDVEGKLYRGPGIAYGSNAGPKPGMTNTQGLYSGFTKNKERAAWARIRQWIVPAPEPFNYHKSWGITAEEFDKALYQTRVMMGVNGDYNPSFLGAWHLNGFNKKTWDWRPRKLDRQDIEKYCKAWSKKMEIEVDKVKETKRLQLDKITKKYTLGGKGIYGFLKEEMSLKSGAISPPPAHMMTGVNMRIGQISKIEDVLQILPLYIKQLGRVMSVDGRIETVDIIDELTKFSVGPEGKLNKTETYEMVMSNFGLSKYELQAQKFWSAIGHILGDPITWVIEAGMALLAWGKAAAGALAAAGSAVAAVVFSLISGLATAVLAAFIGYFIYMVGKMICKSYDMADACHDFPTDSELKQLIKAGTELSEYVKVFNESNWGYTPEVCKNVQAILDKQIPKDLASKAGGQQLHCKQKMTEVTKYLIDNNPSFRALRDQFNKYGVLADKFSADVAGGISLLKLRSAEKYAKAKKGLGGKKGEDNKKALVKYRAAKKLQDEVAKISAEYNMNNAKMSQMVTNFSLDITDIESGRGQLWAFCQVIGGERNEIFNSQANKKYRETLKKQLQSYADEIISVHKRMSKSFEQANISGYRQHTAPKVGAPRSDRGGAYKQR